MTNDTPRPPCRLLIVTLLALIGLGISAYLSKHFYEVRAGLAGPASCDVNSTVSCTAVAETKYAELADGVPLSSVAAGWFAAMVLISLLARKENWRVEGTRLLTLMALVGTIASLGYLAVMAFIIKAWCLWCLGIDAVNFSLLALLISLKPAGLKRAPLNLPQWLGSGLITLAAMTVVFVLLSNFAPAPGSVAPPPIFTPGPTAPDSSAATPGGAPDPFASGPGPDQSAPAGASGPASAGSSAASGAQSAPVSAPMSSPAGVVPADIAALDPRLQELVAHFFDSPKETMRLGPDLASMGPAGAPVTMVEFSDYQCSHCKHAAEMLPRILARYPGKIRLVNRHYPLSSECNRGMKHPAHPAACEAAKLAYCAVAAGKFQRVHDTFFRHMDDLLPERLSPFLEEAGADAGALYRCSDTPLAAAAIQRDVEEGLRLNVESTPTFFINGRKLAGFYPPPFWYAILDRLVAGDERVPPFTPPPPGTSLLKHDHKH